MVEYRYPGVYVEEVSSGSLTIEGVSTTTAGCVSVAGRGPLLGPLESFMEFEQAKIRNAGLNLTMAIRGFFENGGRRFFVSQIAVGEPLEPGLGAFDGHSVSVVCCPDDATITNATV